MELKDKREIKRMLSILENIPYKFAKLSDTEQILRSIITNKITNEDRIKITKIYELKKSILSVESWKKLFTELISADEEKQYWEIYYMLAG